MGSGGTEWDTADNFDATRLNQKTRFVGTSQQATNLITDPQVGQMVYSTGQTSATFPLVQNDVFPVDKIIIRNAADDTWQCRHMTETSEQTEGTGTASPTSVGSANYVRVYKYFTLPTSEKFYIIHKIDTKVGHSRGDTQTVTWQLGIDIVNADPPTVDSTVLAGITARNSQSMASTGVAISEPLITDPIRGGSVIGIWAAGFSTGTSPTGYARWAEETGLPNSNRQKIIGAFADDYAENTSWTSTTEGLDAKIYYYGYS